jgi:hypothetical protein
MGKPYIVILFCLSFFNIHAQNNLCVFKTSNKSIVKSGEVNKTLKKGDFLKEGQNVLVFEPTNLVLIDSVGNAFSIKEAGTYSYQDILKNPFTGDKQSLTSKYFKLVWDEMTNNKPEKTVIGGVFRGDVLMKFPRDSTRIAGREISLEWKVSEKEHTYFIYIKNLTTDEFLVLSSKTNALSFYKNRSFFDEGNTYEWTVSKNEFPDIDNAAFYSFSIIKSSEYEKIRKMHIGVIKDLKKIGLTNAEVEESLCEIYGLCK